MTRAVFLDRDGTIIEDKDYLSGPEQVVIFPGATSALSRLQDAGFKLFIVTNQSGIGRGYYTMEDMHRVNARLLEELGRHGVHIEKIYFAPEAPEQPSRLTSIGDNVDGGDDVALPRTVLVDGGQQLGRRVFGPFT